MLLKLVSVQREHNLVQSFRVSTCSRKLRLYGWVWQAATVEWAHDQDTWTVAAPGPRLFKKIFHTHLISILSLGIFLNYMHLLLPYIFEFFYKLYLDMTMKNMRTNSICFKYKIYYSFMFEFSRLFFSNIRRMTPCKSNYMKVYTQKATLGNSST